MATADSTLLLEARGLSKRFFGALALDGASFGLGRGEIHALVGENGAGKSTFIKILAGVYQADGGQILLEGAPVDPAQHPLPIAFVHQDLALVDDLSVGENIALTAGYPRRGGLIDWPAGKGDAKAKLAVEIFTRSVKKAIGGFMALMGGADAVVFAGGIGENDARSRAEILDGLGSFGILMNSELNEARGNAMRRLSASDSVT